ncbi:hypothetical protein Vadar_025319 [Vaccinium darrowii]|uniref:Uncharacterized protein n=1 Tax=Vaccinium darrowii TaxID=229202 RepID=A0ACB7YPD3_9ERIC|nr:hypothetical protein Vadar_025319 [Vaccinium darrowii]
MDDLDSDSDANYEHFSDSDYDLSEEDDMLYQENVDVNEQYGSKNEDLLPPSKRVWTMQIKDLLPAIEHRHCVRRTTTSRVLDFQELEKKDPAASAWLSDPDRNPCHCSRSHFIFTRKCDILLNNLCEPFNKAILFARDKPLLTMLERLRFYLMDRNVKRRDFANKWVDDLGPKIHKKIEKIKSRYSDYHIVPCGEREFEARHINWGQYSVILKQSCSCRRWELTGIPCEHGALVIAMQVRQPEDYVSDWYSKHTFLASYNHILHPMNGQDMWENVVSHQSNPHNSNGNLAGHVNQGGRR